jgi:hypothetical protein
MTPGGAKHAPDSADGQTVASPPSAHHRMQLQKDETRVRTHRWFLSQTPTIPKPGPSPIPVPIRATLVHSVVPPHRGLADDGHDPRCEVEHCDAVDQRKEEVWREGLGATWMRISYIRVTGQPVG